MSDRFPDIGWYCDRCNASLNDQPGFDDHKYTWKCTECGHKNSISSDDIYESEEDFRSVNNQPALVNTYINGFFLLYEMERQS